MSLLSSEVANAAKNSVLCWLATVDASGQPNVSPKEIYTVFDASHVVVANIASPTTVRNIEKSRKVCLAFVDVFVQKGFKIYGVATNVRKEEPAFAVWAAPLLKLAGPRFPIHSVIVISATTIEPVVAPSYRLYPGETTEQSQFASALQAYGVAPGERGA